MSASTATPANQIPTKPGFYWVRPSDPSDSTWRAVQVVTFQGCLGYKLFDWQGYRHVYGKSTGVEWGGECVPPTL